MASSHLALLLLLVASLGGILLASSASDECGNFTVHDTTLRRPDNEWTRGVAFAYIDDDKYLDAVFPHSNESNYTDATIVWRSNAHGSGTFSVASDGGGGTYGQVHGENILVNVTATRIYFADMDSDAREDMVVVRDGGKEIGWVKRLDNVGGVARFDQYVKIAGELESSYTIDSKSKVRRYVCVLVYGLHELDRSANSYG